MNIDTKVYRKHESPTFGNTLLGAVPLVSEVYLMDNIELMKHYPDKYFDLAVVDPPYGIGADGTQGFATKKTKGFTFNKKEYTKKNWDSEIPTDEYFFELQRVSKNQIVWGANYFISKLPHLKNFIYWHKKGQSQDDKFNEGEIAFVSCGRSRMIDIWWNGFGTINSGEKRFHPTQKPVKLYDWIFMNYTKEGDLILDTHLGSGSSRISANKAKLHFVGCEIDEEYFNKQNKRYEEFVSQARLW
jgi:site-specific DNA-methyltransferase (adenine-specific)